MSASELKRCPFCGGKAQLTTSRYDGTFYATCGTCFVTTQSAIGKEEAIAAWNRRAGKEPVMIEIIYRVRFPGEYEFIGCASSKYYQILVHQTDGKYEVLEGVYDSYCDQFERPHTNYDFKTARTFDSAFDADDYARKRFFELQGERVVAKGAKDGK